MILLIVLALVAIWQYGFEDQKSRIDDTYRLTAASGLAYDYASFMYFYYYLDLFPVTSRSIVDVDTIPDEYLNQTAAEKLLYDFPDSIKMDHVIRIRTGDLGKIFLFWPDALIKGHPGDLSVRGFLAAAFAAALLGLLVSFWKVEHFPLGLLMVLFLGSHPFQVFEAYANFGRDQNMGQIFSIPITAALLMMSVYLPMIFDRPVSRVYLWSAAIGTGVFYGVLQHIRSEPVLTILGCLVILMLYARIRLLERIVLGGVIVLSFWLANEGLEAYFDYKFDESYEVVAGIGAEPIPKGYSSHLLWHPLWTGLGDFDEQYGFAWSDGTAIASVEAKLSAEGLLDLSRIPGDPSVYQKPVWLLPEYDQFIRQEVLTTIRNDPGWYVTILAKRLWRLLTDVAPLNLAVGRHSVTLISTGLLLIPLAIYVFLKREWSYIKMILFSLPLVLPALLIYSGRGMTYYAVYLQISAAIALWLLIQGGIRLAQGKES